jgi:hypothetical protein
MITGVARFTASTALDRLQAECHWAVGINNLGTGVAG